MEVHVVSRKKKTCVFLVVGPPNAGKTTLIRRLLLERFFGQHVGHIRNEDGEMTEDGKPLFDGGTTVEGEERIPLLAGCFGCRDEHTFRQAMDRLGEAGVEWIVVDPLGFMSGSEAVAALQRWAGGARVELHLKVLSLINVSEMREAELMGFLSSQVAAATVGIGLNRVPSGVADLADERLLPIIATIDRMQGRAPIFLFPPDRSLPPAIAAAILEQRVSSMRLRSPMCGDACQHDHHVGDRDSHLSPMHIHLRVRAHLGREVIVDWFGRYFARLPEHGVFRIRGVIGGVELHRGIRNWEGDGASSDLPNFLTLHLLPTGEAREEDFRELTQSVPVSSASSTEDLLRADQGSEANDLALRAALERHPRVVVYGADGVPVTNPWAMEVAAELRKRPGIDPELKRQAIRLRVAYYLACAYVVRPGSVWWSGEGAEDRKLAIAMGACWFSARMADWVGTELVSRTAAMRPLLRRMLADGVEGIVKHHSDLDKACAIAHDIAELLPFLDDAQGYGWFVEALGHARALASHEPKLNTAWEGVAQIMASR